MVDLRNRAGLLVLTLALCFTSSGCFTYAVRSEQAKIAPYKSKTLHAYLWNLIENDKVTLRGFDVTTLNDDGLIERIDGFFGPLRPLPKHAGD